jgi:hypothetical protein
MLLRSLRRGSTVAYRSASPCGRLASGSRHLHATTVPLDHCIFRSIFLVRCKLLMCCIARVAQSTARGLSRSAKCGWVAAGTVVGAGLGKELLSKARAEEAGDETTGSVSLDSSASADSPPINPTFPMYRVRLFCDLVCVCRVVCLCVCVSCACRAIGESYF